MTFKIYETDTGEPIEKAHNAGTAKAVAVREAEARGKAISYQEIGTKYAKVIHPKEKKSA
jgi:hypothetical protein